VDPESQLVEQAVLEQQLGHSAEAVLDDVLAVRCLEPLDLRRYVARLADAVAASATLR